MKTVLPKQIKSIAEAKLFLKDLFNNDESYHPEDDASTIKLFTAEEADKLNQLMDEIFALDKFDPCAFLLHCDPYYKVRCAFDIFADSTWLENAKGIVQIHLAELCEKESNEALMSIYLMEIAKSVNTEKVSDTWLEVLGKRGFELIKDIIKYEL